jgi:hypothetical protein
VEHWIDIVSQIPLARFGNANEVADVRDRKPALSP